MCARVFHGFPEAQNLPCMLCINVRYDHQPLYSHVLPLCRLHSEAQDLSNQDSIAELSVLLFELIEEKGKLTSLGHQLVWVIHKLVWSDEKKLAPNLQRDGPKTRNLTYIELCRQYQYERKFLFAELAQLKEDRASKIKRIDALKAENLRYK